MVMFLLGVFCDSASVGVEFLAGLSLAFDLVLYL